MGKKSPRRHTNGNATPWSAGGIPIPPAYQTKNFGGITYVMGHSLDRYFHAPHVEADNVRGPNTKFFLVYSLPDTPHQETLRAMGGCDGCPVHHRPTFLGCSANQPNVSTPMNKKGVLYNAITKKPLSKKVRQINEITFPTAKVRGITLQFL